jgi:uncharacterized protein YrrD
MHGPECHLAGAELDIAEGKAMMHVSSSMLVVSNTFVLINDLAMSFTCEFHVC